MALISVEDLRELLNWPGVRRVDRLDGFVDLRVVPRKPALPPLVFVFSGDLDFLICLGMGEWHSHPELEEALVLADDLMHHRLCILEERNRSGGYIGSAPVGPRDILPIVRGVGTFRRVFFDREPVTEVIDLSLYVKADHNYISRQRLQEVEDVYRRTGFPRPDWLRRIDR